MPREADAPYRIWGDDLDATAVQQLKNACKLPVAVAGALMPDAHVGYGLPIGGVLATQDAVIPYAVGVDIACRMKMTVLDLPVTALSDEQARLTRAIERETRFGMGATFQKRRAARRHGRRLAGRRGSPRTEGPRLGAARHERQRQPLRRVRRAHRDRRRGRPRAGRVPRAAQPLGQPRHGRAGRAALQPLARELHPGAAAGAVASGVARSRVRGRPGVLGGDGADGPLRGGESRADPRAHRAALGVEVLLDIENHHNFAWRERHRLPDGREREVIVHRKGATPAGAGVLGIIPGSMGTPGYVVRGKGVAASLTPRRTAPGRRMSRTQAKEMFTWDDAQRFLRERGVTLLSAGLDEVPMAYKDIDEVMAAQSDLVEPLARFEPRLVKMAPSGEPPED